MKELFRIQVEETTDRPFNPITISMEFLQPRVFFASQPALSYLAGSEIEPRFNEGSMRRMRESALRLAVDHFLHMISKELNHQIEQLLKVNVESKSAPASN